jgi:hypothetical protein
MIDVWNSWIAANIIFSIEFSVSAFSVSEFQFMNFSNCDMFESPKNHALEKVSVICHKIEFIRCKLIFSVAEEVMDSIVTEICVFELL